MRSRDRQAPVSHTPSSRGCGLLPGEPGPFSAVLSLRLEDLHAWTLRTQAFPPNKQCYQLHQRQTGGQGILTQ